MTNSDLPPAYNSLHTSIVNIAATEDTVPITEDEDESEITDSFEDKTTRLVFIQKVLTIKILQLLGESMIMMMFVMDNYNRGNVRRFMNDYNSGNYVHMFILSTLAVIVTYGLLIHCDKARRTNPYRYVFLVACPLSYTLLICFTMIWCEIPEISAAWINYCIAMFSLLVYSIFACQSELEFAAKYGAIVSCEVLIVMYAITVPFLNDVNALYILYLTIAVGLDITFLLFILERMTSKYYRISMTPADFVDGAVNLHVEFYYVFVNTVIPKANNGLDKLIGHFVDKIDDTN